MTRITALRGARSFVDWQKRPAFVKDLDLQRSLIVDRVADSDPALALDLMWRFLELAKRVFERVDDSSRALQDIADGEGDVDAYIALIPEPDRPRSRVAAGMARRLLAAGRAAEALAALEVAKPQRRPARGGVIDDLELLGYRSGDGEWETAYIDTLDALGQRERAQACRWAAFEERLSVERLRAYLKALPDFDDVVAEDKAMVHARAFPHFLTALHFFHEWPNPAQAAELILARPSEIDGNAYYLLDPAARWLEGRYPLAATLLRRAMIEDTLDGAKSSRYKHAARHLLECLAVAPTIGDFGSFETHDAFTARLRAAHGRKAGFWSRYAEIAGKP